MDIDDGTVIESHMTLLAEPQNNTQDYLVTTPLFTPPIIQKSQNRSVFTQYGLLGQVARHPEVQANHENPLSKEHSDCRLFYNIMAPSSAFICGSQGSGKSHTLSCLLENCLTPSHASVLPNPLTGLLFHYDTFISDDGGSPCEAVHLASLAGIKVRILCSPTNITTIKRTYSHFNVDVQALKISSKDLNTKRMLDLMAINSDDGTTPLYVYTLNRILRELRIQQQDTKEKFDYDQFKAQLLSSDLTSTQIAPLTQRLSTLESFMPGKEPVYSAKGKYKGLKQGSGTSWDSQPGLLTIVDLSCPCITPAVACALFNVCLSLFLEQRISCGRLVALDEAHKYMTSSAESATLTNTLLSAVRLQRHLGVRVFVSTQEPTIEPALLDLCSITIVHRFNSPAWLRTLRAHAGLQEADREPSGNDTEVDIGRASANQLMDSIVSLGTGQALLLAPTALIFKNNLGDSGSKSLNRSFVKVRIRARLSEDGGSSVLAR